MKIVLVPSNAKNCNNAIYGLELNPNAAIEPAITQPTTANDPTQTTLNL